MKMSRIEDKHQLQFLPPKYWVRGGSVHATDVHPRSSKSPFYYLDCQEMN